MSLSIASTAVEFEGWATIIFRLPTPALARQAYRLQAEIGNGPMSEVTVEQHDAIHEMLMACVIGHETAPGEIDRSEETLATIRESGALWGVGGVPVWYGLYFRVGASARFQSRGGRGGVGEGQSGDQVGQQPGPDVPA